MDYVSLPSNARRIVATWADDIRDNPRYQDKGFVVEEAGSVGEYRFVAKGGFWNDDTGRAPYGITKDDVVRCRRELRAIGFEVSWDDVDALLMQAVMGYDGTMSHDVDVHAQWRSKRQLARERARAEGRCIICLKAECAPKATCADCGRKANEARKRRKQTA